MEQKIKAAVNSLQRSFLRYSHINLIKTSISAVLSNADTSLYHSDLRDSVFYNRNKRIACYTDTVSYKFLFSLIMKFNDDLGYGQKLQ